MARMFRSSTSSNSKQLYGSLDVDEKLITVPKGWSAQTGALLLPDVVIGKLLGEGFQAGASAQMLRALFALPVMYSMVPSACLTR